MKWGADDGVSLDNGRNEDLYGKLSVAFPLKWNWAEHSWGGYYCGLCVNERG